MRFSLIVFCIFISLFAYGESNESELNRENKNYQFVWDIGGSFLSLPINGVGAYKFIEKNKLVGFHILQMKDGDDPSLYNGKAYLVNYKEFRGNSFYFEIYGYYRDLHTIDKVKIFNSVRTEEGNAKFEDIGFGINIGNAWQWKYFTLGVDWIGLSKRVATLKYKGESSDFFKNSADMTFLHLYLGASF